MTTGHSTDFDTVIERAGTNCVKYDVRQAKFGRADVIPLWVADMDFAVPRCVQQALTQRAEHPVFGYTVVGDSLLEAMHGWYTRRHHWQINPAQLQLTPGVVPSLFAAVAALTKPGDGVLVPTPVYPPFFDAVRQNGRVVLDSRLLETPGGYTLDFNDLEKQAIHAGMLLLCSPHNPVGRVWSKGELEQLIALALRHDLVVVSDEIHCDLVYSENGHIPLPTLAPPELRLLTAISPSKTFNIPGLSLSGLVASHAEDARAIQGVFNRLHVNPNNPFTLAAFEAAYTDGDDWLDGILGYLDDNRRCVKNALAGVLGIEASLPQATCLMWLDCRQLGLDDARLQDLFIHKAGLGLNPGDSFGPGGSGFMRLNIGTRRALLEQALQQLQAAL